MDFLKILLSAAISVVLLFLLTKLMGHKQVAQLDFFDYISGITIGSIGAELATDLESPWKAAVALAVYAIASVLFRILTQKFPRSRKYINGTPTILMDNGKLHRENLKKAKLDLSEFLLLCREQGYFDLEEIQTAIFESNGKISVLPAAPHRPVTPNDLNLTTTPARIGVEIIMDGRILQENLRRIGRDMSWLENQLHAHRFHNATEVFLGIFHPEKNALSLYGMQ